MLISIIVPVYNVEKYLKKCIDSILNQTFKDFELILVDDGSKDQCGVICDNYAKSDTRICVIHKKNGGLSDARNAGLDKASGKYIMFIDSDDYVDKDLLKKCFYKIEEGYDIVSFRYNKVNEYDVKANDYDNFYNDLEYKFETNEERMNFIARDLLNYKVCWEAWSRIYRRDIIENNKIRFEDNSKIFAEDLYFNLCYIVYVKKMFCMKEQLYYYLVRNDSIMRQNSNKSNIDRINVLLKSLYNYYLQNNGLDFYIKHFAVIYFFVLKNEILCFYKFNAKNICFDNLTKLIDDDIKDKKFMYDNFSGLTSEKKYLESTISRYDIYRLNNYFSYLKTRKYILYRVKVKLFKILYKVYLLFR